MPLLPFVQCNPVVISYFLPVFIPSPGSHFNVKFSHELKKNLIFSIILKKGSPLVNAFRKLSLNIHEAGISEKITNDILRSKHFQNLVVKNVFSLTKSSKNVNKFHKLTLDSFKGLFIVYFASIFLSFIIFLLELKY